MSKRTMLHKLKRAYFKTFFIPEKGSEGDYIRKSLRLIRQIKISEKRVREIMIRCERERKRELVA